MSKCTKPMPTSGERERFEKWVGHALPSHDLYLRKDGRYTDPTVEILWQAWQAARSSAPLGR